jgi:spermidine/putrescine transport system ATP-binding protein/putrescine transport system ATP-binding protein
MSDEFLRIDHVAKRFGAVEAVNAVDLAIGRGEFFSLLGPSGCGKTTLLRMIAGFEFPDEGALYIDGTEVTAWPPERRPTNMVFQSYAIFPHLNVFDNIAFGLRRARLPRVELVRKVTDALAMVQLEGFGERKSAELSGGQRQRVALARALVRLPKVLLLDEPLGALDKRLREAMQLELRQLQRGLGITFLFVTHDQEEALSMSDRIAVMSNGRVLQVAAPRALYETPNCREVADFIGSMNFFDASVMGNDGRAAALDAGPLGKIRAENPPAFATAGARIVLALRPERISLTAAESSLSGSVASATYLGERTHLLVGVEGLTKPVAVTIQNSASHNLPAMGERVVLSWEPTALVLLEK